MNNHESDANDDESFTSTSCL